MLNFEAVDIGFFGGRSHIRPEDALENIQKSANELTNKVLGRGLEIATIFLIPQNMDFLSLATNNPDKIQRNKARDLFLRTLEFTVKCNVSHLSAGAGVHWEEEDIGESLKRDAEELSWRVEQAKEVGVTFAIEPHVNSLASTPKATLDLIKMAPGLTLALDYAHFTRHGVPDHEVEPLIKYSSHFHARAANSERLQAKFSENEINFEQILKVMKEVNYQGYISLEYVWTEWERCDEVDNLSETILLRDYLRSLRN